MESLKPEVSVLLPVKRWRSTTAEAVQSILDQSLKSLEVLLIGHDDVEAHFHQLPQDSRIRYIAREGHGIVAALNTGLARANGSFIARMDDDDVAYPERLETQIHFLNTEPKTNFCATQIRFIDESGGTKSVKAGNVRYAEWLNDLTTPAEIARACYTECPMPHPTWMAHKSEWRSLNGYRAFDGPEDYDFILRAMLAGKRMGKPNKILQDWREHPERLTYSDIRYRREAFTRCRAWAAVQADSGLELHSGRRGVWICGTGKHARFWHDALSQLQVNVKGFVDVKTFDINRRKRDKQIIDYTQLPTRCKNDLVITALPDIAVKQKLKHYFMELDWLEGKQFIYGS